MSTQEPAVERPSPAPAAPDDTYVRVRVCGSRHTHATACSSPLSLPLSKNGWKQDRHGAMAGVAATLLKSQAGAMVKSGKQEKEEVSVWLASSGS